MADWDHASGASRRVSHWCCLIAAFGMAACGHRKRPLRSRPQRLPPVYHVFHPSPAPAPTGSGRIPVTPVPDGGVSSDDKEFILSHRPIYSEEG